MVEDLVLFTEDCPSATPGPTQEHAGSSALHAVEAWIAAVGLKGGMNRALGPLLLQPALSYLSPQELKPLYLAGSKRFHVCIALCLSLPFQKG